LAPPRIVHVHGYVHIYDTEIAGWIVDVDV
jgi:hypothetical protein